MKCPNCKREIGQRLLTIHEDVQIFYTKFDEKGEPVYSDSDIPDDQSKGGFVGTSYFCPNCLVFLTDDDQKAKKLVFNPLPSRESQEIFCGE